MTGARTEPSGTRACCVECSSLVGRHEQVTNVCFLADCGPFDFKCRPTAPRTKQAFGGAKAESPSGDRPPTTLKRYNTESLSSSPVRFMRASPQACASAG